MTESRQVSTQKVHHKELNSFNLSNAIAITFLCFGSEEHARIVTYILTHGGFCNTTVCYGDLLWKKANAKLLHNNLIKYC